MLTADRSAGVIVKHIIEVIVCIALLVDLALSPAASRAASAPQRVTCPYGNEQLSFAVPAKMGGLPAIDFDYPVKATIFSFRDGHLLLIAMDQSERSRVRIVISAQLNKAKGTYDGQMVLDLGGNELQLQGVPVSCTVSR